MRRKKIFGLDISDHSIEAVLLKKTFFGKPRVISYSRTILIGEVVRDGVIKNPNKLAESISKLLKEALPRPIKAYDCILSLPDSQAFSTIFKFPAGLKRNEIKNTIPFKAEEIIPFKSSDIYFDFKAINIKDGTQEVFYIAAPIKIIDGYIEILRSIGLNPIALDLESISLARALLQPSKKIGKDNNGADRAIMLMDIGARTTNFNIFDRNGIRQGLNINTAGNKFTKAIVKNLGITVKQANELKSKVGFDPKQKNGKVVLILQKEFGRLINEVKKLINYYQEQTGRKVELIVLSGGSALLPQIDRYLSENLGIEVKIGNALEKIADPEKLIKFKKKSILFANVIGLGLRCVAPDPIGRDINLLPLVKKKFGLKPGKFDKRSWRFIYVRLAVLGLLFLILAGMVFLQKNSQIDFYEKIFPMPHYQSSISPDFDPIILDELRMELLLDSTSTPTTTPTTTQDLIPSPIEPLAVEKIKIKSTSLGYLNVRQNPGTNSPKIAQVNFGQEFVLLEEQNDWYKIQVSESLSGWVYSLYADKIN